MESRATRIIGASDMLLQSVLAVGLALGVTAIFGRKPVWSVFLQGERWPLQIAWGAAVGCMMIVPTLALIFLLPGFGRLRRQLIEIGSRADLSGFNPLWLSLCAGIGEEMLFRGGLQPLLGLWWTSALFTAVHYQTGGYRTMNAMKAVYAILVFLASTLLGTLFIRQGLIAAMAAHIVVDVAALTTLRTCRT